MKKIKLYELIEFFKWSGYDLDIRANTNKIAVDSIWRGKMSDFKKKDPVNESPYSKARNNHLGNYWVREVESNDGEEDLITVYIEGRSESEFYEEQ